MEATLRVHVLAREIVKRVPFTYTEIVLAAILLEEFGKLTPANLNLCCDEATWFHRTPEWVANRFFAPGQSPPPSHPIVPSVGRRSLLWRLAKWLGLVR